MSEVKTTMYTITSHNRTLMFLRRHFRQGSTNRQNTGSRWNMRMVYRPLRAGSMQKPVSIKPRRWGLRNSTSHCTES